MKAEPIAESTIRKLEFHKIKEQLANYTLSPMGREQVEELIPSADIDLIRHWQKETSEARELLRMEPDIPFDQLKDIRHLLLKLDKGAVLEALEILAIAKVLSAGRRIKKFIMDRKDKYPLLAEAANSLLANKNLEDQISFAILDNGEIADTASSELLGIRRQIKGLNSSIKDRLDHILRSSGTQKYLQENIVTVRGDRYVVPVKQEYRSQFPGIVHDQSASGATIFVEPMAIVEKNNELRRLFSQEKQEIIRILANLSGQITMEEENITDSVHSLGHIDFILSKGRLSQKMDGCEPTLNVDGYLAVKKARHPLITGKVVPIDVHLGKSFDILVITGPNTGGKTVTLKTVGLITLMAKAGMHIPAEPGSEVCIYRKIFADIGDEQSIEQSLSTFSSHMTNIISLLSKVDKDTLVLLDELGAGTDPAEGAALAMAILDHLHDCRAKTIATTHYSELKAFAFAGDRVENASVEFDIQTLKPTYRLNIGQPGHSSAFDIASGLGLTDNIVEKAKDFLSKDQLEVAELIQHLEANRRAAEQEYEEARIEKVEITRTREKYNNLLAELEKKKSSFLEKARQEASDITRKAKYEAEEIIKELKEAKSEANLQAAQKSGDKLRKKQEELWEQTALSKPAGKVPQKVKKGQTVYIPKLDQKGIVQTLPDLKGDIQVQIGLMKINIKMAELRMVEEPTDQLASNKYVHIMKDKTNDIKNELDLRGQMVEESLETVDKYLDDCSLAGVPQVCLIHGKGTGALRSAINDYLKTNGHVKSFRAGQYGEGGIGVTVVELK